MKKFRFSLKRLLKSPNKALFFLEVTFNLLILIFFFPLLNYAFDFIMRLWGQSYITDKNITSFLTYPPAIIFLVLFLTIFTIMILWKMTSMIHYCFGTSTGKQQNTLKSFVIGLFKMLKLLITGNIGLPFLALLIYLFTNIPILIGISLKTRMPINLTAGSDDLLFIRILMVLSLVLIAFIGFRSLFTLHFCINEKMRFFEGLSSSKKLMKGRNIRTGTKLLIYNIALGLIFYLVYNLILLVLALLIYFFSEKNMAVTVFLYYYPKINIFTAILFSMISYVINLSLISSLYIKYKEETGITYPKHTVIAKEEEDNLIPIQGHKQVIITFIIFLVAIGLTNFYVSIRNNSFHLKDALLGVHIASHRGHSVSAPENTLPALELAIEAYSDYAEIDVQQTKDGVLVLLHDKSLRRTTGLNKFIWTLDYEEIRGLDAGAWFSDEYIGTHIPTLEEAMELCKGRINLNIEIKPHGYEQNLEEKLVSLIEEYDYENQCIISSSSYNSIVKIKSLNEDLKTGLIISVGYGNFYNKPEVDFLSMRSSFVTKSVVESAHLAGKEIHAWTVNTRNELERMKSLGVDNIITDNPTLAKEVLLMDDSSKTFVELLNKMLTNRSFYQIVDKH